jgi:hypothetical protein
MQNWLKKGLVAAFAAATLGMAAAPQPAEAGNNVPITVFTASRLLHGNPAHPAPAASAASAAASAPEQSKTQTAVAVITALTLMGAPFALMLKEFGPRS